MVVSFASRVLDGKILSKLTDLEIPYFFGISLGLRPGHYSLNKFGYNSTLPTSYEDVWEGSSVYTYTTIAQPYYISSSNASDAVEIELQGLDENYNFQILKQKLNGRTKTLIVSENIKWFRTFRAKNVGSSDLAGTMYVYEDDTVTDGVPDTASKWRALIVGTNNQTQMGLWTVPAGYKFLVDSIYANTSSNKLVTAALFARPFGKVFQLKHTEAFTADRYEKEFKRPLEFAEKTDLAMRAKVTVAGGDCYAGFGGTYVEV